MIQIQVKDIKYIVQILNKISQLKMPAKESLKIMRMIKHFGQQYSIIDETYQKLVTKYAQRDENGNIKQAEDGKVYVDSSQVQQLNKQWESLNSSFITLNDDKIPLQLIESLEFTPQQMGVIECIIQE